MSNVVRISRELSATLAAEDLAQMVHPHQPVIDLEVAIEKLGWKVALALAPYWQEMDKPEDERDQAVIAKAAEEVRALRRLQDELTLADSKQIRAILEEGQDE